MNKIEYIIKKVRKGKEKFVKLQEFEKAYNWREVERNLIKVNQGESLRLFFEQLKNSKYENFEDIYEVIKTLDVVYLRREKLLKIKKLYE